MELYKKSGRGDNGTLGILREETGAVALLVVLWVIVLLTAIVGEFSYSMRTETKITRNFKEEAEAYYLALSGIEKAKTEILLTESQYTYLNEDGVLVFNIDNEAPQRSGNLVRGSFSYNLSDEESKLNINTASALQMRYLFLKSGVDITDVDIIVDSIIDWRDENDLHMLNGAEEDYYRSLEYSYSCKDGPFELIDELLLVKGMTKEIFYGSKDADSEQKYTGVVQYLTVNGLNTININTSSDVVLEAVLGVERAAGIIAQREAGPIKGSAEGKVSSDFFTITSTGVSAGGAIKRTIKTTVQKKGNSLEAVSWDDNFFG
ncbi:MAG: general secretion pathway protein GspK [Nitrospirae bacterium]|nr:general secretion pathway protein GspK [Nitrospirota bacterium]